MAKMTNKRWALCLAMIVAVPAVGFAAAPDTIKARQANFKKMGAATKAIVDEIRKSDGSVAVIRINGAALSKAGAAALRAFPRGTGPTAGVKTAALPEIWTKPKEFEAARQKFLTASRAFNAVAAKGDMAQVRTAFGALGATCKGCHDQFRAKDD
jgi:cytochrome c556